MNILATLLRAMQLFAHAAHNRATGPTFFADHEHLGGLYETYEKAYDDVIERMIGLGESPDLCEINRKAAELAAKCGDCHPQQKAFEALDEMEAELCKKCETAQRGQSIGTINFLQGLADSSEQRQYLLGQRIKK